MKVCLYGELSQVLKGSGIGSAIDHQKKALEINGLEVTRSHRDRFDIIDINTIGPRSAYVAQKMRWKGIPVIMHTHTTVEDLKDSFKYTTRLAPKLRRYLRFFYNQADHLVSPSEYTRNVVKGYGVDRDIEVISNGVDLERFEPNREARRRYRRKYGLDAVVPFSVGHVFKRKGVFDFLELAGRFPQNQFMWYGRVYKDLTDKDLKEAVKKPPKNVTFTGYIRDVVAAYNSGDILLFPSYCENQGISILEAAACAKPIIVRDLETYEGWLEDGVNCLKARDNEGFEQALKAVLEDEKLRRKMAKKAYEMSRQHSLDEIGGQLKRLYEKVI